MLRVINLSGGHSKEFLGFQGTAQRVQCTVAHYEAVEDALLAAADVFSPTEVSYPELLAGRANDSNGTNTFSIPVAGASSCLDETIV
jgi:hypothetical protein